MEKHKVFIELSTVWTRDKRSTQVEVGSKGKLNRSFLLPLLCTVPSPWKGDSEGSDG